MVVESKPSGDTTNDVQMETTTEPTALAPTAAAATRKRPRLDLTSEPRERKRGKTMFGLLVGTLNKARTEDKQRNATDAAKKRQMIEQRLQDKLKKETDSVRRAEEAKKEKQIANRKEEELQLKDSIHKLRRTRLPLLSNFLLTSDIISTDSDTSPDVTANPLAPPPRTRVAPLYYLPAILTPEQEAFLAKRKEEVKGAVENEWESFRQERTVGIEEIGGLRKHVQEEEARKKSASTEEDTKAPPSGPEEKSGSITEAGREDAKMEIDEPVATATPADKQGESTPLTTPSQLADLEKKDTSDPMQADEDDAVEY
ncbi:hypothetical protein BJ322DRAFT_1007430 [Thelephora terrestris]|uniref:Pinin/SDK/MemA protein domain-containing protein n=1 Tax=Thelephora terrestris TaxID=56493 RepID=A0A9P6L657_9AGAM|nr:hypothetical protein BJ322DRAFT_1007430 [Thelephora terrestris]